MGWIYIVFGLITGAIFASQGAINGRLAQHIGGPLPAALISFSVGWSALFILNLAARTPVPQSAAIGAVPWWGWFGGLIGAAGVTMAALSVPKIGVAPWVAAIIAGQLLAALFLDHIGAFGQAVREVSFGRVAGALCLAAGVYLIRRY